MFATSLAAVCEALDDLDCDAAIVIVQRMLDMPLSDAFVFSLEKVIENALGGRAAIHMTGGPDEELLLEQYNTRLCNAARKAAELAEEYYIGAPQPEKETVT